MDASLFGECSLTARALDLFVQQRNHVLRLEYFHLKAFNPPIDALQVYSGSVGASESIKPIEAAAHTATGRAAAGFGDCNPIASDSLPLHARCFMRRGIARIK